MKKFCCAILVTLGLSFTPLFGQMILTEEDAGLNPRATAPTSTSHVMVPLQGVDFDQWEYAPLGDGLLILAGLGGAYLLAKRKRKNEE